MLNAAVIFAALFIIQAHSYNYGFPDDPRNNWDAYDLFASESRSAADIKDVEEVTERDREPLAPDYKDPDREVSPDFKVTEVIEPHNEKPEQPNVEQPPAYDSSITPGGILDANADDDLGFGALPHIPSSFGFSTSFGSNDNIGHFPGGLFGLDGLFRPLAEHKPWWKGENVCIEREESTDDEVPATEDNGRKSSSPKIPNFFATSVRLSNCQETSTKYECITKINNHGVGRTFVVRYKCCYGFQRTENSPGCTKKIDLVPLLDTIENIKETEFKKVVLSAGLERKFQNENLTVFVPTNVALSAFSDAMTNLNEIDPARRRRQIQHALSSKQLVLNHIVPGYYDLSEVENEDVLYSENNNNSIRINIYPTRNYGKMTTANCAYVRKETNLASNGIVHVVDGVLSPVTQSVLEIIAEHPQLSSLYQGLQNTNLTKNFKPNGHYTVFAPTNEAFNKLGESAQHRLVNGDACAATILKHHIVAHTVCSPAIIGHATTHSVDGELLNLQKTEDDVILFEDKAKITKRDIVASNGVIHLIDTVAMPDAALYITESLKKENFTKFLDLIKESGLADDIDSLKNVTVFAPSDKAFDNPDSVKLLDDIKNDKQKLKDLIMYHTTQGELESCNMNNNMQIKSNIDKTLRVNLYSTLPIFSSVLNRATVNCARVTGYDEKSCGAMIHEVNQILTPPTKTLLDLINTDDNFKTLSKIVKGTNIEEMLKDNSQSLTVLAPSDAVFAKLDEKQLNSFIEDKKKANTFLKDHILTELLCCSGIGQQQPWGINTLVSTLSRQHQPLSRIDSNIRIGRATITECDNIATNGVIHTVNNLLYPFNARSPGFGVFIFDL